MLLSKINKIDFSQVGNSSLYFHEIPVVLGKGQILKTFYR